MTLSADQPELAALAGLADVDPEKLAGAINAPIEFFQHLSLAELAKIHAACDRLTALNNAMLAALNTYAAYSKGVLEGAAFTAGRKE